MKSSTRSDGLGGLGLGLDAKDELDLLLELTVGGGQHEEVAGHVGVGEHVAEGDDELAGVEAEQVDECGALDARGGQGEEHEEHRDDDDGRGHFELLPVRARLLAVLLLLLGEALLAVEHCEDEQDVAQGDQEEGQQCVQGQEHLGESRATNEDTFTHGRDWRPGETMASARGPMPSFDKLLQVSTRFKNI